MKHLWLANDIYLSKTISYSIIPHPITTFGFFIASMLVRLSLWLETDGLKSKPRQKKPWNVESRVKPRWSSTEPEFSPIPTHPSYTVRTANFTASGTKTRIVVVWGEMKQTFGRKVNDLASQLLLVFWWVRWLAASINIWKIQVYN